MPTGNRAHSGSESPLVTAREGEAGLQSRSESSVQPGETYPAEGSLPGGLVQRLRGVEGAFQVAHRRRGTYERIKCFAYERKTFCAYEHIKVFAHIHIKFYAYERIKVFAYKRKNFYAYGRKHLDVASSSAPSPDAIQCALDGAELLRGTVHHVRPEPVAHLRRHRPARRHRPQRGLEDPDVGVHIRPPRHRPGGPPRRRGPVHPAVPGRVHGLRERPSRWVRNEGPQPGHHVVHQSGPHPTPAGVGIRGGGIQQQRLWCPNWSASGRNQFRVG